MDIFKQKSSLILRNTKIHLYLILILTASLCLFYSYLKEHKTRLRCEDELVKFGEIIAL
jgi:hypothetical protein